MEGKAVASLRGRKLGIFFRLSSTIPLQVLQIKDAFCDHVFSSFTLTRRVEYVTITPDGFRYRSQIFPTVNGLFRWFKDHYHEPVPGTQHIQLVVYMTSHDVRINKTPSPISGRHHSQQQQSNQDACVPERHPR